MHGCPPLLPTDKALYPASSHLTYKKTVIIYKYLVLHVTFQLADIVRIISRVKEVSHYVCPLVPHHRYSLVYPRQQGPNLLFPVFSHHTCRNYYQYLSFNFENILIDRGYHDALRSSMRAAQKNTTKENKQNN